MSEQDTTILDDVRAIGSPAKHRLYYCQGNFFYPLDLHPSDRGRVNKAIRQFKKLHAELIKQDRAHPNYKTILELFDG